MIIDVHGHLFRDPEDLDRVVESGLIEQAWLLDVSFYEDLRIKPWGDRQAATQEEVLQASRDYPGFFIPFGFLDFRKPPETVQELGDMGFQGLKAIAPMKPYDDLSYFPYYEKAQELELPILFHSGIMGALPYRDFPKGLSQSSRNMTPSALYNIAASFPSLTVIGAHLGSPWFDETARVLHGLPNVYFDISGGDHPAYQSWLIDHLHWTAPLRDGSTGGFADKILMGIDAMYGAQDIHDDIFAAMNRWQCFFDCHGPRYTWGRDVEKMMRLNAKTIQFPRGTFSE